MKRAATLAAAACVLAHAAHASFISPPDIGVSDGALAGVVVAIPDDAPRILFHNPAGITKIQGTEASYGLFLFPVEGRYSNEANGFDEKSGELALSPVVFAGTDRWDPWFAGVGVYGSVGTSFNFGGDENAGFPNRFLGESSVLQLGLLVGREVLPGLRVGLQLAPNYGKIRLRTPSPLGPIAFDVQGFGIGGGLGLLYDFGQGTTFGLGYRAPARVWMSGDADVGALDDDVEITLHVPQAIEFGFAHQVTEALVVTASARWTDYPDFENGVFEYERGSAPDTPFIRSAKARFRAGAGFEVALSEAWKLRSGFSTEDWMMEEESLSPVLYDNSDWIVGAGIGGWLTESWRLDTALGYAFADDRVASADRNPAFPGRYQLEAPVVAGFMISYKFSGD